MKFIASHKAGPVLQVVGLLLFWVGSILPFVATWGRLGFWVALAGVVLGLSGLLLQLRATRHATDAESLGRQQPGPGIFFWEVGHRRTVLPFGVALGLFVVGTSLWYATGSTGPLKLAAHRQAIRTYSPYLLPLCCGFLVGVVPSAYAFQKAALLAVLLAVAGGAVHWAAGRWGIQVDWPDAQGSMMAAFLSALFILPLTMLGCALGKVALCIARRAGQVGAWCRP